MNRGSPGRTGNERRGTENNRDGNGNNRDGTGNNRDGTIAPPGPYKPQQSYGNAPVNVVRVPVLLRYIRK
ncbi:hypothetical protein DPMN_145137 [Dreissena polymorpha]|uniref:Uncharacterized protein n=1 Tax=Dreissena polymorpha TaxID=45954 RepID=A0A9D4F4E1_DREPO|nr:hypothetical protein DPMN_145137 [Dreissena polymorpha]